MSNGIMEELKLKPLSCELNFLCKSDGSAIVAQGDTVVIASVNGPLDVKSQSQSMEKATLEVLFSTKGGKPSIGDRYKENAIKQTCESAVLGSLYPRSGVIITVQELEDHGGLLSCCINAVCLALLNSGISMNYVFASVTCIVDESGNILLDPSQKDLDKALASMTFVFESKEKSVITVFTDGSFTKSAYVEATEKCRAASDVVFDFYRSIVRNYSCYIG